MAYYYLRAYLPELIPLQGNATFNHGEWSEFMMDNLQEKDKAQVSLVLLKNDLKNFIRHYAIQVELEERYPIVAQPSNFNAEVWSDQPSWSEITPEFFMELYENNEPRTKEDFDGFETKAWQAYYEYAKGLAIPFLKDYLNLEAYLYSYSSAYLKKRKSFPIRKVEEAYFKVVQEPQEAILNQIQELTLEGHDIQRIERMSDQIVLGALGQATLMKRYNIEGLLYYVIQLITHGKWSALDAEQGKQRKDKLVTRAMEGVKMPV